MTHSNANHKWVLQHKTTGQYYPTFSYRSREAARKAARAKRFAGLYTPVKVSNTLNIKPKTVTANKRPPISLTKAAACQTTAQKCNEFKMAGKVVCKPAGIKGTRPIARSRYIAN